LETLRKSVYLILDTEECESLQSFFLTHSLGGGTGSGFGTYILGLLEDYYPDIYRYYFKKF
jgi:tubulin epsilon